MKMNKILPDLSIKKIQDNLNKHESDISNLSNPNLLINSNFMNAVNKSGLKTWTSYNSNEIQTIDKWCIFGGSDSNNRSVELGSGGCLLIYGTGSISAVYQKLESLDPGVYSLSAKIDDKIYKATLKWNNAAWKGMEGPWCHTEACPTQSCRSRCPPTLSPAPPQQWCGVQEDIIKLPRNFKKFLLPSPDLSTPALSQDPWPSARGTLSTPPLPPLALGLLSETISTVDPGHVPGTEACCRTQ